MIYVPDINYACYVVQSEGVIRAYEQVPANNITVNYRDYYINSDYIYRDSYQQFSTYTTLPTCLDSNVITDNFYYRTDLDSILFIFSIFALFIVYIPLKVVLRFFRRFQ